MRVNGEWLSCEDEVIRPTVQGTVLLADGQRLEVSFLLDAGADRTVFSARFLRRLQSLEKPELEPILLSGVGGAASSITVETMISFVRDDGRLVTVRGQFGVFTEGESAELSVLGRDVTNNFSVIYDYPRHTVALLSPPHFYEIKKTS
ncbi:MAG: hypothetical protein AABN33_05890 [Acidobacteriota bacterium]